MIWLIQILYLSLLSSTNNNIMYHKGIGKKLTRVKQLKEVLAQFNDEDIIALETTDENGDVIDLFDFHVDVIEGIKLYATDGTPFTGREIRLCQRQHEPPKIYSVKVIERYYVGKDVMVEARNADEAKEIVAKMVERNEIQFTPKDFEHDATVEEDSMEIDLAQEIDKNGLPVGCAE